MFVCTEEFPTPDKRAKEENVGRDNEMETGSNNCRTVREKTTVVRLEKATRYSLDDSMCFDERNVCFCYCFDFVWSSILNAQFAIGLGVR